MVTEETAMKKDSKRNYPLRVTMPEEELIVLRNQGVSNQRIAELYGCGEQTVMLRVQKLVAKGLLPKKGRGFSVHICPKELEQACESFSNTEEVAEYFGCSKSTIAHRAHAHNIATPGQIPKVAEKTLRDLASQGLTRKETADRLGVTYSYVASQASKLKIEFKKKTRRFYLDPRRTAMNDLIAKCGYSNEEVAIAFDITRQRVHQILNDGKDPYAAYED